MLFRTKQNVWEYFFDRTTMSSHRANIGSCSPKPEVVRNVDYLGWSPTIPRERSTAAKRVPEDTQTRVGMSVFAQTTLGSCFAPDFRRNPTWRCKLARFSSWEFLDRQCPMWQPWRQLACPGNYVKAKTTSFRGLGMVSIHFGTFEAYPGLSICLPCPLGQDRFPSENVSKQCEWNLPVSKLAAVSRLQRAFVKPETLVSCHEYRMLFLETISNLWQLKR